MLTVKLLFIVSAALTAAFAAHSKNRNAYVWGFFGIAFPIIAFIAAICVPPAKAKA